MIDDFRRIRSPRVRRTRPRDITPATPPSAEARHEHPAVRIVSVITDDWAHTLRFALVLLVAVPVLAAVVWLALIISAT